ncbi:unnamed protein product, partial [Pylaiella littoralis]
MSLVSQAGVAILLSVLVVRETRAFVATTPISCDHRLHQKKSTPLQSFSRCNRQNTHLRNGRRHHRRAPTAATAGEGVYAEGQSGVER